MTRSQKAVLAAVFAHLANGCGTVCNFAGPVFNPESEVKVYGGVQRDVAVIEELSSSSHSGSSISGLHGAGESGAVMLACLAGLFVADPALSLVADTLTLPIAACIQSRRLAAEREAARGQDHPSAPLP